MNIWFKAILFGLFAVISLIGLQRAYYHYTGDFRLSNISFENTGYQSNWTVPDLNEMEKRNLTSILNQKFEFIGKGNQSYAFVSEDRKYVLKFFKFGHIKPDWYWSFVPSIGPLEKLKKEKAKSQEKRFFKVFTGYQIAYEYDKENAGLIYVHLNKTTDLNKTVLVKDKLGFEHAIHLDDVVFVVQEKVIPTKSLFVELLAQGDLDAIKMRIGQIFDLYLSEYQKGIYDRDHNLIYNTGFTKDRAVRLDVGKLRKNEQIKNPEVYKKDLKKIAYERIDRWFKTYYPQYREEVAADMEEKLKFLQNL